MPTAVAIQCVEATAPKVPSITGRVVKGFGEMLLIGSPSLPECAATLSAARLGGQRVPDAVQHEAKSAFTRVFNALWPSDALQIRDPGF